MGNDILERGVARFFFEVGYGSCWAEAYIRNGETAPFELSDHVIERAWQIAPEAHDDHAEFDANRALADAAPSLAAENERLRKALEQAEDTLDQIIDDFGGGQSVCLAVKGEAIETLAMVRITLSTEETRNVG